jgi:hypothetical protein
MMREIRLISLNRKTHVRLEKKHNQLMGFQREPVSPINTAIGNLAIYQSQLLDRLRIFGGDRRLHLGSTPARTSLANVRLHIDWR